jgi:DNA modification methylase
MIDLRKGDCLEIMKTIPDGSIDAVITDPPYGTTACKWDSVIDFDLMWEQLNRIIKPNGAIVLFGSEPFSSALRMSNIKNYKYDWIWEKSRKTGHLNAKKMPLMINENISVFYKKQPTYNPQGLIKCNKIKKNTEGRKKANVFGDTLKDEHLQTKTNYPTRIIKFANEHNVGKHPTQKPVPLMEYLIKTYTNENETVLDFTMGSGTTGVASKNLNRNFIGIEMDDIYFNIAKERINN